jgi:hypothetical protein
VADALPARPSPPARGFAAPERSFAAPNTLPKHPSRPARGFTTTNRSDGGLTQKAAENQALH